MVKHIILWQLKEGFSVDQAMRVCIFGLTFASATFTCSGCAAYPFNASSFSNVESSIKSALEDKSPSVCTQMSTNPGIFPFKLSSPIFISAFT